MYHPSHLVATSAKLSSQYWLIVSSASYLRLYQQKQVAAFGKDECQCSYKEKIVNGMQAPISAIYYGISP
jgi:hypothetical protein